MLPLSQDPQSEPSDAMPCVASISLCILQGQARRPYWHRRRLRSLLKTLLEMKTPAMKGGRASRSHPAGTSFRALLQASFLLQVVQVKGLQMQL